MYRKLSSTHPIRLSGARSSLWAALACSLLLASSGATLRADWPAPPADSQRAASSRRAAPKELRFVEAARQSETGAAPHGASAADAGEGTKRGDENRLRPIGEVNLVVGSPEEMFPPDYSAQQFDRAGVDWQFPGASRPWAASVESWQATALCHRPLYFEEVNLERYGKSLGIAQPAVSAAGMCGRVLTLPYMIGATPPWKCVYTLGEGRPGSYMPCYLHRPPVSLRGGLLQATAVTGAAFIIP